MPTGYTAPVEDGTITEFRDYALNCARAFGALFEYRESDSSIPIPAQLPPPDVDYYLERIAQAKAEVMYYSKMKPAEVAEKAKAYYDALDRESEESANRSSEKDDRFAAMQAQVEAWKVPNADYNNFKDFMLNQIQISRHRYEHQPIQRLSPEEWREERLNKSLADVEYNHRQIADENRRWVERNQWWTGLQEALA